jgi:LuxR family maltose regulon positive regulatory protein
MAPTLTELEQAIRAVLPTAHQPQAAALAELVAGQLTEMRAAGLEHPVQATSGLIELLGALAGTQLAAGSALISFGANNQFGDVTIGDVAGGNLIKISLVVPPPVSPPPLPEPPPTLEHFVGRRTELEALGRQLDEQHVAILTGMPGVGKTALAATLMGRAAAYPRFWHSFREGEGVDAVIWRLAAFLAYHGRAELWELIHRASQVGGAQPHDIWIDYLTQNLRELRCLICLDDLHLASEDPLLHRLVDRVGALVREGALFLIITARTTPMFLPARSMALGGLSLDDTAALAAARGVQLSESALAALHTSTEGNAQFLVLALTALQRAANPDAALQLLSESAHVERYLLAEVHRGLSADERDVMAALSALLGYGGTRAAIEAVLARSGLRAALGALRERALLTASESDGAVVYGQHSLVRAFYYDDLGTAERRALHRRASAFYETEGSVLRAALHAERAGDAARAATLAAESRPLILGGEGRTAARLLARLADAPLDTATRARVLVVCGEVELLLGDEATARAAFLAALDLTATLTEDERFTLEVGACRGMGELLAQSEPEAALTWLGRGLALVGANAPAAAALHLAVGGVLTQTGRWDEARTSLESSLRLLPAGPSYERAQALNWLAGAAFYQNDVTRAEQLASDALGYARRVGEPVLICQILVNIGTYQFVTGRWIEAVASLTDGLALAERIGDVREQILLEGNLGSAYLNIGDDDNALRHLHTCVERAQDHGMPISAVIALLQLSDLHLREGRLAEAAATLAEAELQDNRLDATLNQLTIANLRAELLLMQGQAEAALHKAQDTVAAARASDEQMELGAGLRLMALALAATGHSNDAGSVFEESIATFERQHMVYEAARVRAEWGTLLRSIDPVRGAGLLAEARAIFARLGARRDLARLDGMGEASGG